MQVFDVNGNVATTFAGSATASLALPLPTLDSNTNPITVLGTLQGTRTVPFVSGNAIFTDLTITGQVTTPANASVSYTKGLQIQIPNLPGFGGANTINFNIR